ncbi:MAG: hypothetical protein GXO00_00720 [Candidatus Diapherotrites archaeon]|nr:hypothetical protein [Candidatus Diapherotrites archaeon]
MRQLTSLDHYAIASEFKDLAGRHFQKLSTVPGGYKLKLRSADVLVIFPDKVFLTSHSVQSSEPDRFAQKVRKELKGRKLQDVKTLNLDRVLLLDFGDRKLVFELFREGNALLLDGEGKILALLRGGRWRHRELGVGVMYKTPPPPPISEGRLISDSFLIRDLVRSGIPKPYALEILHRLGLGEKDPTQGHEEKVLSAFQELLGELDSPAGYICQGEPFPISLSYLPCEKYSDSFSEAIDSFIEEFLAPQETREQKKSKPSKLDYMLRSLEEMDREIATLQELINEVYSHWSEMEEMLSTGTFRDIGRLRFKKVEGKEAVFEFTPSDSPRQE